MTVMMPVTVGRPVCLIGEPDMPRDIVFIDENLCDGCGQCVPSCEEGAIRIENGKARLIEDRLCDGMGACIGHCPRGAIRIERRAAAAFDEGAVARHLGRRPASHALTTIPLHNTPSGVNGEARFAGGCPGSRLASFERRSSSGAAVQSADASQEAAQPSELNHWPVQLRLVPPHAPFLQGASLLIAADCVPVAYGDFHSDLLRDRVVLLGCPKFDDLGDYVDKLAAIIQRNNLREIVVARMEVPCCTGILMAVLRARLQAGVNIEVTDIVVSTRGERSTAQTIPMDYAV